MERIEKKCKCNEKTRILSFSIFFAIFVIVFSLIMGIALRPSKFLELSEFEKIAIYGYLEDYLSLDKLYMLSGKSSYDNLQYNQSKVKEILDSYYEEHNENIIPTSIITSELEAKYNIPSNSIDFHGILVSNYEYLPEQNAFQRVEGANSGMASIETQVNSIANSNDKKISITNIERLSDISYIVHFNIVSSNSENTTSETGNATISINNGIYELESCNIND